MERITELLAEARETYQRRMIVATEKIFPFLNHFLADKDFLFFSSQNIKLAGKKAIPFKESDEYLGVTTDFLVLDLRDGIVPADIGRLVSTCRGGGLIFLITPKLKKWPKVKNRFHEMIVTPPYKVGNAKNNFIKWFIKKLKEHEGIYILEEDHYRKPKTRKPKEEKFETSNKVLAICATRDQFEAVNSLLRAFKLKRSVHILTADRGRGKSSAIGIALSLVKGSVKVTAPSANNVQEIFKFLAAGLELQGKRYEIKKKGSDMIALYSGDLKVEYWEPVKILERRKADFLVVDEAASIPTNLLFAFLRKGKHVIYSTTVHGYEGSGRSFTILFLKGLKEKGIVTNEIKLEQPIRYAEGDPIEEWLFDTLLLDAEPYDFKQVDVSKLRYEKLEIEKLLEDERKLREYFGIFVLAHYRNNPNDFGLICDAPHHMIRALTYEGHIVCSIQLALEGELPDEICEKLWLGYEVNGNIIPDRLIKYYRDKELGKLKGVRIVRIAVHPKFFGKGIGSKALKFLEREFKFDWIGASFGANPKLVKFWLKNGYMPVHLSPKMNETTGEYSLIVVKGLDKALAKKFKEKFVFLLADPFDTLDVDIVLPLLKAVKCEKVFTLTKEDYDRLKSYAYSTLTYETVRDLMFKLAVNYFMTNSNFLKELQEKMLIVKVLQSRSWEELNEAIERGPIFCFIEMQEIARRFIKRSSCYNNKEARKLLAAFHDIMEKRREE